MSIEFELFSDAAVRRLGTLVPQWRQRSLWALTRARVGMTITVADRGAVFSPGIKYTGQSIYIHADSSSFERLVPFLSVAGVSIEFN